MSRRYRPDDLDDTQFQVIREKRHDRKHLILVPPAKPGQSMSAAGIYELEFERVLHRLKLREPWYNWLSYEALIGILGDTLIYPYVIIDGVRIENAFGSDKMEETLSELHKSLDRLVELCIKGHEEDKQFLRQVDELSDEVMESVLAIPDYMAEQGLRAGLRLGQKLRLEDLDEHAQPW